MMARVRWPCSRHFALEDDFLSFIDGEFSALDVVGKTRLEKRQRDTIDCLRRQMRGRRDGELLPQHLEDFHALDIVRRAVEIGRTQGGAELRQVVFDAVAESGQTKDLGDLKLRPLRIPGE